MIENTIMTAFYLVPYFTHHYITCIDFFGSAKSLASNQLTIPNYVDL